MRWSRSDRSSLIQVQGCSTEDLERPHAEAGVVASPVLVTAGRREHTDACQVIRPFHVPTELQWSLKINPRLNECPLANHPDRIGFNGAEVLTLGGTAYATTAASTVPRFNGAEEFTLGGTTHIVWGPHHIMASMEPRN